MEKALNTKDTKMLGKVRPFSNGGSRILLEF